MDTESASEAPALSSGYLAAVEALRSAAKWLLTAFAAIGTALTAGLQLTGLGELPPTSWRLWVAVGAIGTALAALGYMVNSASAVLTQDWVTLNTFTDRDIESQLQDVPGHARRRTFDRVAEHIDDNRHELYGHAAPDLPTLHRWLREADEEIHAADGPAAREAATRRAAHLRAAAREVVQCANYYATLERFRRMKVQLAWASAVAAVALGTFAYASTPPRATDASERLGLTRGQDVHDHDAALDVVLLGLEFIHLPEDNQVTDGKQHGAKTLGRHTHSHDRMPGSIAQGGLERIGQVLPLGSPHFPQELLGRAGQSYLLLHTSPYERPTV
ncbi:hypothetical protein GCM10010145_55200 [Streptomyces ruber]|uniref:Uncharacterized protein n=2 Tax=Streptomyces TaxID=1883 RepID=A0A918EX46_9ACTN|nr:hypothetical protein [Streptomyces ruber]GGQ78491.1 hypothetical protein GCM10010145_55200 [Streptomyces ruber]